MLNLILYIFLVGNAINLAPEAKFTSQIKGIVITADTRVPVANAYLYIVKGEEEALTNAKGEFTLTTAERMPFSVTVVHKDFRQSSFKVKDASRPLIFTLQRK